MPWIRTGQALPSAAQITHDRWPIRSKGDAMLQGDTPNFLDDESQGDLFGSNPVPIYQPDPNKVRARLRRILAEARAADTAPWGAARLSLYRTIVPQMTSFLPYEEGAQLRLEFEQELVRLKAA